MAKLCRHFAYKYRLDNVIHIHLIELNYNVDYVKASNLLTF